MPARKAATKKKKSRAKATRRGAARRKAATTKKTARKKATKKKATKKKVTKKKAAKKKATKKKSAKKAKKKARKTSVTKKAGRKKAAKTAKKRPAKAAAKRTSSGKKGTVAKRRAAKKPTAARARRSTRSKRRTVGGSNLLTGPVRGFDPYRPRRGEVYMSDGQLEHFRDLLNAWKRELMEEVDRTMLHMKDDAANFPDPNDRATQESEFGLELRTRDRERKLLKKIDSALQRIDDGSYGFCEETGDEIGLRRLEARPVATLCVEAQERRELAERQFRDREDHYR